MNPLLVAFRIAGALGYNTGLPHVGAGSSELGQILQFVIAIAAAVSVLFVVVGGLRFVLSAGDSQGAAKARSTVLYAIIGLVITISAEAIVTFVLNKV